MMIAFRHFPRTFSKTFCALGASLLLGAHLVLPVCALEYEPPPGSYVYQLSVNQTKNWMMQDAIYNDDDTNLQVGFYNNNQWYYGAMHYHDTVDVDGDTFLRFEGTVVGTTLSRYRYRFISEFDLGFSNISSGSVHLDWEWLFPQSSTPWTFEDMGVVQSPDQQSFMINDYGSTTGVYTLSTPIPFYDSGGFVHTFNRAQRERKVTTGLNKLRSMYWRVDTTGMYRWEHQLTGDTVTTFVVLCKCPRLIFEDTSKSPENLAVQDINDSVKQIVSYLGQGGDLYGDAQIANLAEREVLQEYRGTYEYYQEYVETNKADAMRDASAGFGEALSGVSYAKNAIDSSGIDFDIFGWMSPIIVFLVLPATAVLVAMVLRG